MTVGTTAANNVIFQTRPTLDKPFEVLNATVSGVLSADSRAMEVAGTFKMADTGKFTSFTTGDLWVSNLTLGGCQYHLMKQGRHC